MLLPVSLTPENNTDDNKYESNAKETVIDMARTVGQSKNYSIGKECFPEIDDFFPKL